MAQGFITLENGKLFHTRYTGYDEVIRIVIKELSHLRNSNEFSDWLKTRVPNENEAEGDAVFWNEKDEMIDRHIDLRRFKKSQRRLFWTAIEKGIVNLLKMGDQYSLLNPIIIRDLMAMHKGEILSRY